MTLNGLRFHQYPTLKHNKGAPPKVQIRSKAGPPVQRSPHTSGVILSEAKNLSERVARDVAEGFEVWLHPSNAALTLAVSF